MLKISKTCNVKTPTRGTPGSAGYDFYVPEDYPITLVPPGKSLLIPSGIKMMIPRNHAGIFYNKSSIGKLGVVVGAQVVDEDYRGEIHLSVINTSQTEPFVVKPGQKLVQMIIQEYTTNTFIEVSKEAFDLDITERGSGGFGSTGV